jgi:hypothetical protein
MPGSNEMSGRSQKGFLSCSDCLRPDTIAERTVGKNLNLPLNVEQVGFLAQDLEKVVPEAVNRPANKDETYSINEDKLISFLVQVIKYQQTEIKTSTPVSTILEHDK